MPHGPSEMRLPTTLASLLACSGPNMAMPVSPERRMSLETILVSVPVPPLKVSRSGMCPARDRQRHQHDYQREDRDAHGGRDPECDRGGEEHAWRAQKDAQR